MASTAAESTRSDVPPPGMRHTDGELTKYIDNAKDQFGVISASGPHDELANLNAADWKRLSKCIRKTTLFLMAFTSPIIQTVWLFTMI